MTHAQHAPTAGQSRRPHRRGSGRIHQTELVICDRCQERLGHWRNARLVTRQVFATIRRTGRVTLSCAVCSTRTDVTVRQRPTIWIG
jgi:hypothetical protein